MRIALLGASCWDRVEIAGRSAELVPGGPLYYMASALRSAGLSPDEITLFSVHGRKDSFPWMQDFRLRHIPIDQTTTFVNQYLNPLDLNQRKLLVRHGRHQTTLADYSPFLPELQHNFETVVLAPLLPGDLPLDLLPAMQSERTDSQKVFLSVQGLLRQTRAGEVIPRHLSPQSLRDQILPYIHGLAMDVNEFNTLTREGDEPVPWLDGGLQEMIITAGSKGATLMRAGHAPLWRPAWPSQVLDPTGAGDTFLAGYLIGLDSYKDPELAMQYGTAMASLEIEKQGPLLCDEHAIDQRRRQIEEHMMTFEGRYINPDYRHS